jgi:hypothetical protein
MDLPVDASSTCAYMVRAPPSAKSPPDELPSHVASRPPSPMDARCGARSLASDPPRVMSSEAAAFVAKWMRCTLALSPSPFESVAQYLLLDASLSRSRPRLAAARSIG